MQADVLKTLTDAISAGEHLGPDAITQAVHALTDGVIDIVDKQAFLNALHEKGETVEEVIGFAAAFRDLAQKPSAAVLEIAKNGLDYVGTGGDHSNAFNISTSVCMMLASAGIPILKHGNRGATSPSGTADMQEALGFKADLAPEDFLKLLENQNFSFFFAPAYHPAFKHIVPARKALAQQGKRTIFNILGPLINPAQPAFQVLGVYDKKWVKPLADALTSLGRKRGVVLYGETTSGRAVDKAITAGQTFYCGVGELDGYSGVWTAADFGKELCDFEELQSDTPAANATRLLRIFSGEEQGGLLDTLCANAAVGLWSAGRVESISQGVEIAENLISSGRTLQWLEETRSIFSELS
ncbi:MAG: anthranilate phosphoribosyltransferase [Verrucomicrobiota bacterium]